jgi:hypothetical protein
MLLAKTSDGSNSKVNRLDLFPSIVFLHSAFTKGLPGPAFNILVSSIFY